MIFVTSIGTPNERERKEYSQAAGAKEWARKKVDEFAQFAAAYNKALHVECLEVSKDISNVAMHTLTPGERQKWQLTDDRSGVTLIVEIWTEPGVKK